jgi:hypothetical protein
LLLISVENRILVIWTIKGLDEGYNFASNLISIEGLHTKLWASKVVEVPILGISGLPFESLGKKWHLGVGHVAKHRVYYKGEGGGFPQIWAVICESCEFMFAHGSSVHQRCSNCTLTNLLFNLCRSMWVIHLLVNLPSLHPRAPTHPSTPKCCELGNAPQLIFLPLSSSLDSQLSQSKELGGASLIMNCESYFNHLTLWHIRLMMSSMWTR